MSFFDDDDQPDTSNAQQSFFDDEDAASPARPIVGSSRAQPAASALPPAAAVARPAQRAESRGSSVRPPRQTSVAASAVGRGGRERNGQDAFLAPELGPDLELEDDEHALPKESLTEELTRHWWNERCAPEILMQREELLEEALERIKEQSEALNTLLASPEGISNDEYFRLTLIETEVEQLRHICKAYARCRMYKLDKYFDHCLSNPYARARLSQVDIEYCEREQALVHNLLYSSVLEGLPPKYRKLDEEEMIIRPDLDQAVFVTARRQCGPIDLPDSTVIVLEKGSRHFFRYRTVRALVESGDVMLV